MKKPARSIHSSTQRFTEIKDIIGNVVLLEGGNACAVIEITASNFSLLSRAEQDSKIYSYASLLNSLTFPIQIIVRNKRMDISSYLNLLDEEKEKTKNELLARHIELYRDFVREMIKVNVVLSKAFYMVISYSSLESGAGGATQALKKSGAPLDEQLAKDASQSLMSKADSLLNQLRKLATSAKLLEQDELVKLFYDIYNDSAMALGEFDTGVHSAFIRQGVPNT